MNLPPHPAILQASRSLDLGQAVHELKRQLYLRGWSSFYYINNDVGKGNNVSIGISNVVFGQPSVARTIKEAKHIACEYALSKINEWPQCPQHATTSSADASAGPSTPFFLGKKLKGPIKDIVEKAQEKGYQRFAVVDGTDPAIEDAGGEIVALEEKEVESKKRKRDDDALTSLPDLGTALALRPAPAAETEPKRKRTAYHGFFAFRPKPKPE